MEKLICELKKVSFKEADKIADIYLNNMKDIDYKETITKNNISEIAIYTNKEKKYKVLTDYYIKENLYSISIYSI